MARATRGAEPTPLSWDTALEQAADRFARIIREHGPQAVGFYGSGQLLTEDYYVLNKLVKGLIGTNNLDTNSRLCMSSAVAGYKATLGADAPPACYDDFQHAQTLFIVGANTAWAHPILFRRIEDARKANPEMKLIVADPRRTETADMADLFLPIRPGTDVALFHGMLNVLISEGLTDPDYIARHTQGFEALATLVQDWTPQQAAATCGIPLDDLVQAARWMGSHTPSLSLYCQGLNQSSRGTDKNAALINLHLATGQIGKPGAGPFSLTGQPNAMGGREVGGMANLLSAHRDLANPAHREEVAPCGRGRGAGPARADRGGDVRSGGTGRDQGLVDRLHQPGPVLARPGHGAAGAGARRVCRGAGGVCDHGHLRPRRPAAARHHLGREGWHRDQQITDCP